MPDSVQKEEERRRFEAWKAKVDRAIARQCMGLTSDDLPDVDYWSLFLAGESPREAACYAIQNAKEG